MPEFKTLYPNAKILVVDDDPATVSLLSYNLQDGDFRNVVTLEESRLTLETLEKDDFSCVLLDLLMPSVSGNELLPKIVEHFPNLSVIIMTAVTNVDTVVSCMRHGAFDYLSKPIDKTRLFTTVEQAIRIKMLKEENLTLKRGLLNGHIQHPDAFKEIITAHPKMKALFSYMEAVAHTQHPILITGESGTGKELFARALYRLSNCPGEFVPLNVAGLDDTLFSDTLFGHMRGAYTGATTERKGLIRSAENGVIFLDEIGDLEIASQIKLLRLLQEREFRMIGSDRISRTNTRFIVASNKDLEVAVEKGRFREDLYFRLKTHLIHIPPLRDRLDDLPFLIECFTKKHARLMGKPTPDYPPQLLDMLGRHHFPGNLRELENLIVDAVICCNENVLPLDTFMKTIKWAKPEAGSAGPTALSLIPDVSSGVERILTLKELEADHIEKVLRMTDHNITRAANILGLNYSSLYRRLKRNKSGKTEKNYPDDGPRLKFPIHNL